MSEFEVMETETAETWKNTGNDLYKAKNYTAAIDAYSKAIQLDPSNALLYTNRAAAEIMIQQYKEAIQDCDQALVLDNACAKAFFRKGNALKGLGQIENALNALSAGLAIDPSNAVALQDRTILQNAKGKIAQATEYINTQQYTAAMYLIEQLTKELGSGNREINMMKVKTLLYLKRMEEALNLTNSLMRTAQNGDSELLGLRARCLFSMGEVESSLKHLQQAVRSDPDNTEIRAQYRLVKEIDEKKSQGDEHFKDGNLIEAIHSWSSCITLTKDSPSFQCKLYLNRATALFKQKKYDDAVKDCTKAIYYNHDYVKAYVRRSECYLALGGPDKIQKAIDDLETAIEMERDEDVQENYKDKLKKAKVALKRSKRTDLYALLGVSQGASESEIKSAYKKAALKFHPDKQQGKTEDEKKEAEAKFKSIGEAYEVLSNPEKKARYDSGVELEDLDNPHAGYGGGGGFGGHGGHGGIDPNILFQMFMQQQGGGGFRF